MNKNPLLDDEFLKELYRHREKEIFAKVIALTLQNDPIEEIQGQITGGSISLDGASNVRRSCSLSLVAKDLNINQYYWGLKTRFRLFIGLRNTVGWNYDEIIWFPMGVYVISAFNTSQSVNNYTISITGKDKMCLLNGDLSGSLFTSVDFGKEEYYANGVTTITPIPVKNIIREAVHAYADETWENIVVNDLEDYGIELLDYNNSADPMFLYFQPGQNNTHVCLTSVIGESANESRVFPVKINEENEPVFNSETNTYEIEDNAPADGISLDDIAVYGYKYDQLIELDLGTTDKSIPTIFTDEEKNQIFTIAKIVAGQTCGYRLTDITYPNDLILGVGEPITAMLDKLVSMLGNFEYFYDVDGRFIFQKKPTFVDKSWNNIRTGNQNSYVTTADETYVEAAAYSSPVTWTFGDSFLITSYANTPLLSNVRNDFSIWGTKTSITGSELPVHLRYAIDKKPTYYKTIEYTETKLNEDGQPVQVKKGGVEWTTEVGDWWVKNGEGVVDVTYEELAEMVKKETKEKIRKKIIRDVETFEPKHKIINTLSSPSRNEDGSWGGGWWDLRDWHTYYKNLTGQDPTNHMRMYATNPQNDPNKSRGYVENVNFADIFGGQVSGTRTIDKLWLFNAYKYEDGTYYVDTQHNGSFARSLVDDDGIARVYEPPFSGCSAHTYDYFENWLSIMDKPEEERIKNGKKVVEAYAYFYFPDFPEKTDDETFMEYIEREVELQLTEEKIMETITEKGYRHVVRKAENLCDWREIIFQMALDYRKHNHEDDFYLKVRNTNGLDLNNQWYYPSGKTGYEQYYVDMEGFWRQLYCPPQLMKIAYPSGVWTEREGHTWYTTGAISADSNSGIYFSSSTGISYYLNVSYDDLDEEKWINSWIENQDENDGWNVEILDSPETLNFWFDFLEADKSSDLVRYSVPAVGDRAKSVNDNMVKAIYFRETPNAIFTDDVQTVDRKSGYTYLQIPNIDEYFTISSQGKCAYDVVEEYLNLYLYCTESISINSVPIYHLQPNTKVLVYDEDSKINGEYLMSKITIPLTYNGTMSVSATKSAQTIY